jgi:2,4-dienoyl-CoA reductase-like NADH-dependent reductase (Old Yellow Enzyme family)
MTGSIDSLFQPFKLKSLSLRNRIVMAPMTRSFSRDGIPGDNVASYYGRRAAAGVGLILSEGTVINRPASRNDPNVPAFHGDRSLAGWRSVIDGVHDAGGKMGPQLWHVGAMPDKRISWTPKVAVESPSGFVAPGIARGEAMSDAAIADTISAFARAAADAQLLGFDTLELHGAHGYLIDQFFWSATNKRSDVYGGKSLKERSRFAAEVIRAVRAAVGPDFPIIIRLSQWKQHDYSFRLAPTPAEMSDWLLPLVEAGTDMLHCSQRRFWLPEFPEVDGEDGLNFAGWAKKLTGAASISVGSVGLSGDATAAYAGESSSPVNLTLLASRLERGDFDLIAVGRALLCDPNWVEKIRTGRTNELLGFTASAFATLS